MIHIGIDPGLKGGLAVLKDGRLKHAIPLPIFDRKVAVHELQLQLGMWPDPTIAVELQGIRPNQAGAMTILGNYGRIMAIIELGGWPHKEITPAQWSRAFIPAGLTGKAKKQASYSAAVRVFGMDTLDRLKIRPSTDGMVEAALIARWMYEHRG